MFVKFVCYNVIRNIIILLISDIGKILSFIIWILFWKWVENGSGYLLLIYLLIFYLFVVINSLYN